MLRFAIAAVLCGLAIIHQTTAQKFSDVTSTVNYPGISDGCFSAMNTIVNCPGFLFNISPKCVYFAIFVDITPLLTAGLSRNPFLTSEQVSALCTPECESTLSSVQSIVAESCAGEMINYVDSPVPGKWNGR
jgi:hypothetical protein